tara:strand:- start:315 stop:464 length:150 start_codon:yes stop_codon:yes gene_type:complete
MHGVSILGKDICKREANVSKTYDAENGLFHVGRVYLWWDVEETKEAKYP